MWQKAKTTFSSQQGQALPLALAFLIVASFLLVPTIGYATSGLRGVMSADQGVKGLYAADAGIEYLFWSVSNGRPIPPQLPDEVNGMTVSLQYENKGPYTFYLGQLAATGVHSDYLVITSDMVWDGAEAAYRYTITVTYQPRSGTPVIHLEQVGARLPRGYHYVPGSANDFPQNLSRDEPSIITDAAGAEMVNWVFDAPRPSVRPNDPVKTQKFYVVGEADPGDYTWIVAERTDVGTVGDVSGDLYVITSTARRAGDGAITAIISADALIKDDGSVYVVTWQVLR
ncbi:MAG: hypothetical protein HY673_26520 [Chloroflexi bacterium]|nr:hypothetical protein [Chloroflexota bacterium]